MSQVQKKMVVLYSESDGKSYLEARRATKKRGGLPSNVLHDDYLVRTDRWREIKGLRFAWAREVLVYPDMGEKFKKGKDVVDSYEDERGRKWILPASYIPEEAIGREKVGLFVDPEDVKEERGKVVVHPKPNSVVVLHPFIQEAGMGGRVDENTRIPLKVKRKVFENLPEEERRWLLRRYCVGVRPLVRDYGDRRQHVLACERPDTSLGVVVEVPEKDAKKLESPK